MPETIGKYEFGALLGNGGMGMVYRGRDTVLNREVAIKLLHPHLTQDPHLLERFRSEAMVQAGLVHPNIVTVYDFVGETDKYAIVMEFVSGRTLEDEILHGGNPIAFSRCLELFLPVLDAMGFAHEYGVVHRDIKPANIMIAAIGGKEVVKVADFGIAKALGGMNRTVTGATMGTMHYMSPEQIKGAKDVDNRADIYSLGVTLYVMATGHLPFNHHSDYDIMTAHLTEPPPRPTTIYSAIASEFETVILQSMAKQREERFPTAAAFRFALEEIAAEKETARASDVVAPSPHLVATPQPTSSQAETEQSEMIHENNIAAPPVGTQMSWEEEKPSVRSTSRRNLAFGVVAVLVLGMIAAGVVLGLAGRQGNEVESVVLRSSSTTAPTSQHLENTATAPQGKTPTRMVEDLVTLTLLNVPEEAEVRLDGAQVDSSVLKIQRSSRLREIQVDLPGHEPWRRMIAADENREYTVELVKTSRRGSRRQRGRASKRQREARAEKSSGSGARRRDEPLASKAPAASPAKANAVQPSVALQQPTPPSPTGPRFKTNFPGAD